jgi:hypothetical protein
MNEAKAGQHYFLPVGEHCIIRTTCLREAPSLPVVLPERVKWAQSSKTAHIEARAPRLRLAVMAAIRVALFQPKLSGLFEIPIVPGNLNQRPLAGDRRQGFND